MKVLFCDMGLGEISLIHTLYFTITMTMQLDCYSPLSPSFHYHQRTFHPQHPPTHSCLEASSGSLSTLFSNMPLPTSSTDAATELLRGGLGLNVGLGFAAAGGSDGGCNPVSGVFLPSVNVFSYDNELRSHELVSDFLKCIESSVAKVQFGSG